MNQRQRGLLRFSEFGVDHVITGVTTGSRSSGTGIGTGGSTFSTSLLVHGRTQGLSLIHISEPTRPY